MSGHSKWSTIKHKKAAKDAKRGKIFTKLIKEITVAARLGGGDINANPRLRTAVLTARQNSMPADNIDRAIKKGTGELEGVTYEEITYEAYGPGGVAILVQVLTDNKTRTVAEIRSMLTKWNGNMGAAGSVAWMFTKRGLLAVERAGADEDRVMEVALEAGADDVRDSGDILEVLTAPEAFEAVKTALEQAKIAVASAEVTMMPASTRRHRGAQRRADGEAARGARGSRRRAERVVEHGHRSGGAGAAVGLKEGDCGRWASTREAGSRGGVWWRARAGDTVTSPVAPSRSVRPTTWERGSPACTPSAARCSPRGRRRRWSSSGRFSPATCRARSASARRAARCWPRSPPRASRCTSTPPRR